MKATDIYSLFEAQQNLFEVEMSPSNLKKLASAIPDARVGMEFEMIVPDVQSEDMDDYEPEEDMGADERVDDIADIVRFFSSEDDYMGQANDPSDVRDLEEELREKFYEWINEQIDQEWYGNEGKEFFADWVKENVDPSAVAEAMNTPEDLFGNREPSKEDWEKFIEEAWDNQGDDYDMAHEAFREEKQDEDFSETQFLRDIGIRDMSDVNSNIRGYIRWPFYTQPDYGMGGEDIESVADDFSEAIGKRVYSSTSYHGARRSEDAYSLEPDSSINTDSGEAGLEFISPPMSVSEMIEDLDEVRRWAKKRGCYTNKSTGLHINVSVPNYSLDNLDYVKLAILMGDKYVLEKFNRYGSGWARSALDIVSERAKDNPEDVDRLLKQVKTGVESIASKLIHSGRTDKYTSINTKDGYVEFRSAGGDWLGSQFEKIQDTMLRFVVALDAACDPNKYKKEYLKGLYKVLKPKDPKSNMSYFARYMAGEITKSELTNVIEKRRKERFKDQGIGILHKDDVEENDWEISYDDGKKQDTIYIANTAQVPNEEAAFKAAQKFKPQWFKPDTIEYVTVKPFKFGEELDDLKLYRAEYGHKYTAVVAEDEEWAKEYVRLMDPDFFASYPNSEITLTDENETSKRKISQMADWQAPKVAAGYEWIKRPKIWRATGRSNYAGRYYIAAIKRDEAIEIAKRLDPDMAESDNFEIYVSDQYPDQDTYDAYTRAQEEVIQHREQEQERLRAEQEAQDAEIDVSNLKVYRVSNMNGYKYVVAENGAEAAELTTQLEPDRFPGVQDLTVQDQSNLSTTSNPALIKSMYHSQQSTLNSRRDVSRGQVTEPRMGPNEQLYVVRNGDTGYNVRIAAENGAQAISRASRNDPHNFQGGNSNSNITVTPLSPAINTSPSSRISDLQRYTVSRTDASGMTNIAATSVGDAIRRTLAQNPTWDARYLTARRLG